MSILDVIKGFVGQITRFIATTFLYSIQLLVNCIYWALSFFNDTFITPSRTFFKILIVNPVTIIVRNVVTLMILPVNLPLYLLFGSTISQIYGSIDISSTVFCSLLLLQYVITTVVLGLFLGISIGLALSILHRLFPIPNVYWEFPFKLPRFGAWKNEPYGQKTDIDKESRTDSRANQSNLRLKVIESDNKTIRGVEAPYDTNNGHLTPVSIVHGEDSDDEPSELTQLWDRDYVYDTIRTETNDDLQVLINRLRDRKTNRHLLDE